MFDTYVTESIIDLNISVDSSDLNNQINYFNNLKGLKIIFFNVSLVKHFIEVKVFLNQHNIDILCLCESWVTSKHSDHEFHINWRCDRVSRRGGGVTVYSKKSNNIKFELITNINIDYEIVVLKATHKYAKSFCIACLYRPHPKAESDLKLINLLNELSLEELVLGGDINLDFFNNANISWFRNFKDIGLNQLINAPTRITDNCNDTCIDHIYINRDIHISGSGVLPIEFSDHKPVFIVLKMNYQSISNLMTIK